MGLLQYRRGGFFGQGARFVGTAGRLVNEPHYRKSERGCEEKP